MKIIGHPWIESERFVLVNSRDGIRKSPPSSVLLFEDIESSIELLRYSREQGLPFALKTDKLRSMLFAHSLGARYVLTGREQAEEFQSVAQHYLFDTEILVPVSKESEIELYAGLGIDGVIFSSSIERL